MDKPRWGKRPEPQSVSIQSIEEFVNGKGTGKPKRLNVVVSADLHRRIKVGCSQEGVSITELLIEMLEKRFPNQ
jgi:predicted HicB family RNase H-like nuclease